MPSKAEPYETLLVDREYRSLVEKIARKHTRGSTISWEDAAQTAHEKVLGALRAGKFCQKRMQQFYPWAATVARNVIVDLIRFEQRRNCQSLHQTIVGTDMPLLETIADKVNLLEAVELSNLIRVIIETIKKLDESYPERRYLLLWQGLVQGKKQTLLARELEVTQGEVSRRRKELLQRLTQELGLVQPQPVEQQQTRNLQAERKRSSQQW